MDRLEAMHDFVRIVETGSLSAAAREARTTQPTLSKRLRFLEEALGVRLLQRNTQGVRLTEAGERYYLTCKGVLGELSHVEAELGSMRTGLRGTLRLNFPVALGQVQLTHLALAFQQKHPEVALELDLTDRVVDLVEERVDVAVRLGGVANPALIARGLGSYQMQLVATPDYLRRHGTPRTVEELSQHDYLAYGIEDCESLETPQGPVNVAVRTRVRMNNSTAVRTAVLAGLGIGRQPRFLVEEEVRAGRLQVVLPGVSPAPMPVYAVYLPGRYQPEKVRAFVQHLVQEVERIPGWVSRPRVQPVSPQHPSG